MSEEEFVPPEYMNVYEEGYAAGLENSLLNPYDSKSNYDSWHWFNSGMIDGYKTFLERNTNA